MDRKGYSLRIEEDGYTAAPCHVCDFEELIGTNSEYCCLHYSAPGLEYNYGHDCNSVVSEQYTGGYYVGIDRFAQIDGAWDKEYMLYEYAVFDEDDAEEVNALLFRHLTDLARGTGCSRILCKKEGGSAPFYEFLADSGFVDGDAYLMYAVADCEMSDLDRAVLPRDGDALSMEELFFLREHGFSFDGEFCVLLFEGERISICRRNGEFQFSDGFQILSDGPLLLNGRWGLGVIDICRQLLVMKLGAPITICPPYAKERESTPDVSVGGYGVFICDELPDMRKEHEFIRTLKSEGELVGVDFYRFSYDFELGGRREALGFRRLK